jgi:hypothetical protein
MGNVTPAWRSMIVFQNCIRVTHSRFGLGQNRDGERFVLVMLLVVNVWPQVHVDRPTPRAGSMSVQQGTIA